MSLEGKLKILMALLGLILFPCILHTPTSDMAVTHKAIRYIANSGFKEFNTENPGPNRKVLQLNDIRAGIFETNFVDWRLVTNGEKVFTTYPKIIEIVMAIFRYSLSYINLYSILFLSMIAFYGVWQLIRKKWLAGGLVILLVGSAFLIQHQTDDCQDRWIVLEFNLIHFLIFLGTIWTFYQTVLPSIRKKNWTVAMALTFLGFGSFFIYHFQAVSRDVYQIALFNLLFLSYLRQRRITYLLCFAWLVIFRPVHLLLAGPMIFAELKKYYESYKVNNPTSERRDLGWLKNKYLFTNITSIALTGLISHKLSHAYDAYILGKPLQIDQLTSYFLSPGYFPKVASEVFFSLDHSIFIYFPAFIFLFFLGKKKIWDDLDVLVGSSLAIFSVFYLFFSATIGNSTLGTRYFAPMIFMAAILIIRTPEIFVAHRKWVLVAATAGFLINFPMVFWQWQTWRESGASFPLAGQVLLLKRGLETGNWPQSNNLYYWPEQLQQCSKRL